MPKSPSLSDVGNILNSTTVINSNNDAIIEAFKNTLSRDGSDPNHMEADLDLNGNDLINVGVLHLRDFTIGGSSLEDQVRAAAASAQNASESATAARLSELASATSADNSAESARNAAASAVLAGTTPAAAESARQAAASAIIANDAAQQSLNFSDDAKNAAEAADATAKTIRNVATQASQATASAAAAATSERNAASHATNAGVSASNAATSAATSANRASESLASSSSASTSATSAAASATAAATSATAASESAAVAAGRRGDGLGSGGQSWQTVTRVSGTTYTNTTGRPIMVTGSFTLANQTNIKFIVGSETIVSLRGNSSFTLLSIQGGIVVPHNSSYKIDVLNDNVSQTINLTNVKELR